MSGATVDVRGILERAGANPDAPEGSQAWALAQVDAAVAKLIERYNIRSLELCHVRAQKERLIRILSAIRMRCAPDDVKVADGRTMRFVPPNPEVYWRELSTKVCSIEQEMRAIFDAEDDALANVGPQP